ncbi:putative neutral sphingomyelinase [Amphiura filiformis]|uniref:putative neutral sphingomyelinase n=1 Tax=Amphiura filiformis TaxID=82378 RepID=UPI003B21EE56
MASRELRVLTLNCWGLAVVSKNREERMRHIAKELSKGRYDIVALQEVWLAKDYEMIQEMTKDVLPYSHYFHSGMVGGGICVLSKGPIIDTFYYPFRLNGYCHRILQGDWYAGKMIGMCAIQHQGITINVYTTHLHALYGPSLDPSLDEPLPHRLVQAFELSEFVQHTSAGSDLVLVMGDLNTEPQSLAGRIIKSNGGLTDAWEVRENKDDNQPGTTCETASNAFTFIKTRYYHDASPEGGRIDYVLYRRNPKTIQIQCKESQLTMGKIPGANGLNYSDHEGVEAAFEIQDVTDSATNSLWYVDVNRLQALKDLLPQMQRAKESAISGRLWFLARALCTIILIIFLSCVSDTGYSVINVVLGMVHVVLILAAAFFFCVGVIVKQAEKNVYVGIEKDVRLRIERLQDQK